MEVITWVSSLILIDMATILLFAMWKLRAIEQK